MDNRLISVATCAVVEMDADVPIPSEMFTLDFQTAKHLIDMDHHRFAPTGSPVPPGAVVQSPVLDNPMNVETVQLTSAQNTDGASSHRPFGSLLLLVVGLVTLTAGVVITARMGGPTGGTQ
jgi:hypothetical protein